MPPTSHRLVTLGGLSLIGPSGPDEDLAKRRRKLALLAVLAMAQKPLSRDQLVGMFWGDEDEDRARHSLSDALSHLRRVLGRDAITARQANIELAADTVAIDAVEFLDACKRKDWDAAITVYRGAFLDGMVIDRSPGFEQWSTQQRERLRRQFVAACKARCESLARDRAWPACGDVAERWLDADPMSVDAAIFLINARKAPGTADALRDALATYDGIAQRTRTDGGLAPDKSLTELAERIRGSLRDLGAPERVAKTQIPYTPIRHTRVSPRWLARIGVIAAASLAVVTLGAWLLSSRGDSPRRTVVVVTSIRSTMADTGAEWLGEGLRQMLASGFDRSARLEVVPPTRVRDALARKRAPLTEAEELGVARALGASWAVRGGITRGDSIYVLDVTVTDVDNGRPLSTFSVTGSNLISLADQAVGRVRFLAAESAGPFFADLETRNVEALQYYVRALQASAEGRYADGVQLLDASIALDSTFPSAVMARLRYERGDPRGARAVRLTALYELSKPRLRDWDRLEQATYHAFHNGEHARAEQLARSMVDRYPHDPRAYETLADVLGHHGKWPAVDSAFVRLLALDSLAIASGDGPCVPCSAYGGLTGWRAMTGDLAGAERTVRRWLEVQPDLPLAWADLASVLAFDGRFQSAIEANRRAYELSGGERAFVVRIARVLIMARRYREADSVIAALASKAGGRETQEDAADLRVVLLRERGRHREALAIMERMRRRDQGGAPELVGAQTWAIIGRTDTAVARYEALVHGWREAEPVSPVMSVAGDLARSAAWHHALMADAIRDVADTTRLLALADTIETVGRRSYYGRDWRLHHHVRGLSAARAGRYADAMRELQQARWGVSGWTRTLAAYADAALAAGKPTEALTALRDAYRGPLDAMGRYLPRSEIDFRMARTFAALGARDSAAVYASYVRRAWESADPEWKSRLAELP